MKTLVPYRNKSILLTVQDWWRATYPDDKAERPNKELEDGWFERDPVTLLDLYQSYCEYTLAPKYYDKRLDLSQFSKCLVANQILNIGGWWIYSKNWEPKDYEVRRANGEVPMQDHYRFLGQLDVRERLRSDS